LLGATTGPHHNGTGGRRKKMAGGSLRRPEVSPRVTSSSGRHAPEGHRILVLKRGKRIRLETVQGFHPVPRPLGSWLRRPPAIMCSSRLCVAPGRNPQQRPANTGIVAPRPEHNSRHSGHLQRRIRRRLRARSPALTLPFIAPGYCFARLNTEHDLVVEASGFASAPTSSRILDTCGRSAAADSRVRLWIARLEPTSLEGP
jgi:hypothetical protein